MFCSGRTFLQTTGGYLYVWKNRNFITDRCEHKGVYLRGRRPSMEDFCMLEMDDPESFRVPGDHLS